MKGRRSERVMTVFPNKCGIGHAVFESPRFPVEWGICDVRGDDRHRKAVSRIKRLVDRYSPDMLVLRDLADIRLKRGRRHYRLLKALEELGKSRGISTMRFSRAEIRRSFDSLRSPSRHAIVHAIVAQIPTFEAYIPPVRKIWQTEDRRMVLFDAAALALAFYRTQNQSNTNVA